MYNQENKNLSGSFVGLSVKNIRDELRTIYCSQKFRDLNGASFMTIPVTLAEKMYRVLDIAAGKKLYEVSDASQTAYRKIVFLCETYLNEKDKESKKLAMRILAILGESAGEGIVEETKEA